MRKESINSNADSYENLLDDQDEENQYIRDEKGSFNFIRPTSSYALRIPFKHFIRVVILLPLVSFIFCVFWALHSDYKRATTVICTRDHNRLVTNYLPSLSAATGDFFPSQYVWKACILLHAPGRFLFASMYLTYLKKVILPKYNRYVLLACILHVIELIGLIGLTVVTSKHNFPIHATSFTMFLVCSELYMILLCVLMSCCRVGEMNRLEMKGLRVKQFLCKIAVICTFLLMFAYYRHSVNCEKGVYTVFALLEYIVVVANIGFNGSAYWDFYDRIIVFDLCQPCKIPIQKYSWNY